MATTVDDEDYAHVVLICSGQFNDPDLQCHLTDITRQLHMLAAGYTSYSLTFAALNVIFCLDDTFLLLNCWVCCKKWWFKVI